ncbi:hypothetical protein FVE85_6272 [Porphyridium purpureum]|uniref:Uncharacterized protein n=1 Tax=Porphyridium purpureum TaxID=35688 RepID=A0A5J4Z7N5_PORPP|nr:hypothetical protein FVE85_6272 [Porphyridium purpureum]|eukprot:POR9127..scf295_1
MSSDNCAEKEEAQCFTDGCDQRRSSCEDLNLLQSQRLSLRMSSSESSLHTNGSGTSVSETPEDRCLKWFARTSAAWTAHRLPKFQPSLETIPEVDDEASYSSSDEDENRCKLDLPIRASEAQDAVTRKRTCTRGEVSKL